MTKAQKKVLKDELAMCLNAVKVCWSGRLEKSELGAEFRIEFDLLDAGNVFDSSSLVSLKTSLAKVKLINKGAVVWFGINNWKPQSRAKFKLWALCA